MDKFKAESYRSLESSLGTNGFWLGYLSVQLQNQEPIEQIQDYAAMIDALKPATIKDMANKYLTGKNYIKLVLMPATTRNGGTD